MFTYDLSTPIGQVRLRVRDTDSDDYLLSDEEIQVFISANNGVVLLAAADALENIASDQVLLLKAVRFAGGVSTDGPAVAATLLEAADRLREQHRVGSRSGVFTFRVTPNFNSEDPIRD